MNACGGSSTSQKIYYGKTKLVTGNALTGTGWTLYSGSPISATITSVSITPVDANVDYSVERYCHCQDSGDVGPERKDKIALNTCGSFSLVRAGSTSISYQLSLPSSLSNAGAWVDKVLVELLNSTQTTVFQTNTINRPFSAFASAGSFTGLTANTNYSIRLKYVDNTGTRTHICSPQAVTTQSACSEPVVTISNTTGNSATISWTVSQSQTGDTFNVIRNGTTIASGLPLGASPYQLTGLTPNTLYQIGVQRNCGLGGQATGQTSFYSTSAPTLNMTCNSVAFGLRNQCWEIGPSVAAGNRYVLTLFGKNISVTAEPGESRYDLAPRLAAAVNAVSREEWDNLPTSPDPLPLIGITNYVGAIVSTNVAESISFTGAAFVS
jgi:hypothetical protein